MLLSVIMPAYNEAAVIEAAVEDVMRDVLGAGVEGELIVIDDGSTDATPALLQQAAAHMPRLRILRQANAGHGPALIAGISAARGELLLLLDSDRQIALGGFAGHLRALQAEGLVAILGVRASRQDPGHRHVVSWLMARLIGLTKGVRPRDAGAPYKLVRRSAWDEVAPAIGPSSWIPSVLLAVHLHRRHPDRIREIDIPHAARQGSPSTLNLPRLARFCLRATVELLRFRPARPALADRPTG